MSTESAVPPQPASEAGYASRGPFVVDLACFRWQLHGFSHLSFSNLWAQMMKEAITLCMNKAGC